MKGGIRKALTKAGDATGHPVAFLIVGVYVAGWLVFDRQSFDLHGVATVATWLMTLLIQRSEFRDTQAIHAKLDELLRAVGDARTDLQVLDDDEPEEIVAHRQAEREKG